MKIMKKMALLFGLTFCLGLIGSAQFELKRESTGQIVNGSIIYESVLSTNFITSNIKVKYLGTTQQDIYVSRKIITTPSSTWAEQICWGSCHNISSLDPIFNLPLPYSMVPNSPLAANVIYIKVTPDPISGAPAHYRYYIGTFQNPHMDSVDLVLTTSLGAKEIKKDIRISVAPNPANENVVIHVNNFETGTLKIVDMLGNVLLKEGFSGSKSVNVEDFRDGVYFIIISGEGMNTINRKLVVRH
jgi:Secretion system C-terminal sorting domain